MSMLERVAWEWGALSPAAREKLLSELAATTNGYAADWWGGVPFGALSECNDFDSLPNDLCGRLMLAVTESGFSVDENARVQRLLERGGDQ